MSTQLKTVEQAVKFYAEHYQEGSRAVTNKKDKKIMSIKEIEEIEPDLKKLFGLSASDKLYLMLSHGDEWTSSKKMLEGFAKTHSSSQKHKKECQNLQNFIEHLNKKLT